MSIRKKKKQYFGKKNIESGTKKAGKEEVRLKKKALNIKL